MAFKLTTFTAIMALIAATQGKVLRYRQTNSTGLLSTPFPLPSGSIFPTGTAISLNTTGTAVSPAFTGTAVSTASNSTTAPTSSFGTAASTASNSTAFSLASSGTAVSPTSTGTATSSIPTGSSVPPSTSGLPVPVPKALPDLAIAFQEPGCNTNGTGPEFAWPNFAPGKCQGLFPNPTYEFGSLWISWTSRQFDCCEVQVYSDNNCESPTDGKGQIYNPYGSCIDAADTAGRSFILNCYNLPIPLV